MYGSTWIYKVLIIVATYPLIGDNEILDLFVSSVVRIVFFCLFLR